MTRLDNDLISRKDLLEFLSKYNTDSKITAKDIMYLIANAPTIEADSGEAVVESLNERLAKFDELNKPKPLNLDIKYDI